MFYDLKTGKVLEMTIKEFNEHNWRLYAFLMPHVDPSIYRKVNCRSIMACVWFRHAALFVKRKYQNKNGDFRVFPNMISHCVKSILLDDEYGNVVPFAGSEVKDMRILFDSLMAKKILN